MAAALALIAQAPAARANDPFLRRTATVEVVEKAGPAVVNITAQQIRTPSQRRSTGDPFFDHFFRDFFEPRMPREAQSLGSGVIIDAERHVLTNEHVVAGANAIRVTLADGREFGARKIGGDPNNDIAVLQVETEVELPWIEPGRSSDLMVGEPVIAIGNPFGLSNTVTTGVVSALDRSMRAGDRAYHGFLQTDASINPGNSGGPLLNADGELIGINTAIYGGGAQGIGFAIPIDAARRVVRELIAHGEIAPVWIGLEFQELTPGVREALELPRELRGALVRQVREDGPGDRAEVERGDIVLRLDGHRVDSAAAFFEMLETATPGQTLSLRVWREGRERELDVAVEAVPKWLTAEILRDGLGVELERIQGAYRVKKLQPESGAARIGIRVGDLVLAIGEYELRDEDSLRRAALSLRGQARALLVVGRGNNRYPVAIPLV
jgi:serine protease Do